MCCIVRYFGGQGISQVVFVHPHYLDRARKKGFYIRNGITVTKGSKSQYLIVKKSDQDCILLLFERCTTRKRRAYPKIPPQVLCRHLEVSPSLNKLPSFHLPVHQKLPRNGPFFTFLPSSLPAKLDSNGFVHHSLPPFSSGIVIPLYCGSGMSPVKSWTSHVAALRATFCEKGHGQRFRDTEIKILLDRSTHFQGFV